METQNETGAGKTLLRISSFGTLSLHRLELQSEPTGTSNAPARSADKAQGRGMALAQTLLKVLLCQPSRFASRDLLMETLWPDHPRGKAQARLDDASSALRTLLRSVSESRANLLPAVHSSKESGNGYQLAPYPLIWVDADAFLWNVEQAARLERFGDDPLPFWERAYELATRGAFLADEPYTEWAEARREELEARYRQCVHALARLYQTRWGKAGEAEATLRLHTYWLAHPTDEDALRPLMELLGKQERYQEAEDAYQRLSQELERESRRPDHRTQDIAAYLRVRQIQRERVAADAEGEQDPGSSIGLLSIPTNRHWDVLPRFSHPTAQQIVEAMAATHQAPGSLFESPVVQPDDEVALGAWIAQSAALLGPVLDMHWSPEAILEVLRIIFPIAKAMPMVTRRGFLQAGAFAVMGALPFVGTKHITEEERLQLYHAFQQSVASGWKLFTMARNAQALAVSQAQLILLQQAHSALPIYERSSLYSSIYNLMGMAFCHQGQYHHALRAHTNSYIAALGAGDMVGVTGSLLGQSNDYHALGQYSTAIETLEQALRTFSELHDQQSVHTKAHLLGVWANCAIMAGDFQTARQKLDAIAALLDQISPNEQFDRSSWCELTGKYAYFTGDYPAAAQWYEQALRELPAEWTIRQTLVLMPLISTYTTIQDRDASLITMEKAAQVVPVLNAPIMNEPLIHALQGLLIVFPYEAKVKTGVSDLLQQICSSTPGKSPTEQRLALP